MAKSKEANPKKKDRARKKTSGETSVDMTEKTIGSGRDKNKLKADKNKKDKKDKKSGEKSKRVIKQPRVQLSKGGKSSAQVSRIETSKADAPSREASIQLLKTKEMVSVKKTTEVSSLRNFKDRISRRLSKNMPPSKEGKAARKAPTRGPVDKKKGGSAPPSTMGTAMPQPPPPEPPAIVAPVEQPTGKPVAPAEQSGMPTGKPQPSLTPGAQNAMDQFYKYVMGQTWDAVRAEYDKLQEKPPGALVPAEQLQMFWDPTVPCLEHNPATTDSFKQFCHANKFAFQKSEGDKKEKPYILAQVPQPTPDGMERFWQMVFHNEPGLIFLLTPCYENGKGCAFFPMKDGEYQDYGSMRVLVKKVEQHKLGTNYTFEVLPDGCSNAFMARVIHCEQWEPAVTPPLKVFLQLMQNSRDSDSVSPIMCVSRSGTGRAAVLTTACIVYNRLLQGQFTSIGEVALALRDSRAGAFENIAQYVFIYVAISRYIKSRINEDQWKDALEHMSRWGQEVEKYCAEK